VISVDWTLGLQFVNFIVLLLILNKLLYKPLQKIIAERREVIESSHQKGRDLESQIEAKMLEYQNQIDAARAEANVKRGELKETAVEQETSILTEARGKAGAKLQHIKSQVAIEAAEAGELLKKQAEGLAGQIASKILGRELV
jgi:F-type H+-transporting ATPase subunit b